jgi:aryl-alcohol dehydrogenase-like predicted oxidoreductase
MKKNKLGKTGLEATTVGFGGMELRWLDDEHADSFLNTVLDSGINFLDTSPEYPLSEQYIGQYLSRRRHEFVLATKCGDNLTGIGAKYLFDPKIIISNVERSLKLLKTDYLDVLQLHGAIPEDLPGRERDEAIEAMRTLKKSGKVRHLGITLCNKDSDYYGYPDVYSYNSLLRFAAWEDIEVVQVIYGCMTRLAEDVIKKAHEDYGTGIVARGIIKAYDKLYDSRFEISRLKELFEPGETKNDFFIRYAISHPGLASSIVGTRNIDHLKANIKAANKGPLPAAVYAEAKRRLNFSGIVAGSTDLG